LAGRDMREAKSYIKELLRVEPKPVAEIFGALWGINTAVLVAVFVVYSRSFKKSRSQGKAAPMLDIEALGLFEERPDLLEVHRKILAARDQAVAHADWDRHKTELRPDAKTAQMRRSSHIPRYSQGIRMDLVWELLEYVEARVVKLAREIDKRHGTDAPPNIQS
jgi:hypothetical protein